MRITINLATRPFADLGPILKRLRIAMIVFAAVCIGLGFGLHALHSKAEAARVLGISLKTIYNRLHAYGDTEMIAQRAARPAEYAGHPQ